MARILILLLSFLAFQVQARDLDKLYKKEKLKIGGKTFDAYIADSDSTRADGLMFITKLPENTGMLFVFEQEQPLSFWMKNTMIPLAIGFINAKGVLVDVQEMDIGQSLMSVDVPTYQSRKPARFALEMNKGWFTRHKIKNGAKLEALKKSLAHSLGLPTSGSPK